MPKYRTVVVRLSPKFTWWLVALAFLCLLLLMAAFYLGFVWAVDADENLRQSNSKLQAQAAQQSVELRTLTEDYVRAKKSAEIDSMAAELVRQELLAYRQKIAALRKDLAFYRGLMAPDELKKGFSVHQLALNLDPLTNIYSYKALVTNAGGVGNVISGSLSILLQLEKKDEIKEVLLSQLDDFEQEMPVKLRFRFFQNIEGAFKLPSEYRPVKIVLSVRVKGATAEPQRYEYSWAKLINSETAQNL